MKLEQIAEYLENPILLEGLPSSEDRTLKLNGLFYILEYKMPEEESITFTCNYLSENPESPYKDYFVHFLRHKNSVGNTEANHVLFNFILNHPNADLVNSLVENNVRPLSKQHATLFTLYQNDRTGFLESENHLEILSSFYVDAAPELRKFLLQKAETNQLNNWVILAKAVFYDTSHDYNNLLLNFERFSSEQKTLTADFLSNFTEIQPGITEILFQLYNAYQTDEILNLILSRNLHTPNAEEYALFLLFTHQWDEYDSFDFDNTYLKNAFLKASPGQRQKILSQSRKSGKFNWLHEISDIKKTKWVSDLNEKDWENILMRLIDEKNEKILLRLLKDYPTHSSEIHYSNHSTKTRKSDWIYQRRRLAIGG